MNEKINYGVYFKSFNAKLQQSSDELKSNFVDLTNYLLSYKGVKIRFSWYNASFNKGRTKLMRFAIRGKTLYVYLPLDPKEYINTKYNVTDSSKTRKYLEVPLTLKIKSNRGLKFAKALLDQVIENYQLELDSKPTKKFKIEDFPYLETQDLVEKGLIKIIER